MEVVVFLAWVAVPLIRRRPAPAVLAVLAALAAAPSSAGEAAGGWTTLAGSGLMTLPTAQTLRSGRVSLAVNVDNRDRDPLGIDVFEGTVAATVGLGGRIEAYAHDVFSRVISMPEPPPLPAAPLDLIAPPGRGVPPLPHHTFYGPTPYVDKRGSARFDAFVPGDFVLGAKMRLFGEADRGAALALAGEVKLPLSRSPGDLRSGAGTGGVDLRLRAIGQWRGGRSTLAAMAAYTRTGDGDLGDRWVVVENSGAARAEERPLELADRLGLGIGARYALGGALAAVVEASADIAVGARTPVLDETTPLDLLGGLQVGGGPLRLTAALRYHGNALPSGARRINPLGGLVDVTDVAAPDLAAYLDRLGAGAAVPLLREGSHRVVAAPAGGPALPAGARRLAADYSVRSEHQIGFVIALGFTF
jgi:hypothetical protein